MKNFLILGLLLMGLLVSGCASYPSRGHNFYRIDGNIGVGAPFTEIVFVNGVPNSIAYLSYSIVPLCTVRGGPRNTIGLCYKEKFSLQYNASPYSGDVGLALSVEFKDETESRSLNPNNEFAYIFPVFYGRGVYFWIFSGREGNINYEIQSREIGGYNSGFFGRY